MSTWYNRQEKKAPKHEKYMSIYEYEGEKKYPYQLIIKIL